MATKTKFQPSTSEYALQYSEEQVAWLDEAYKTIIRLLKKSPEFHVNDFNAAFKGGEFPVADDLWYSPTDSRVLGQVYRQIANEGAMTNSGYAKKVTGASYYRPVWTSNLYAAKVAA